MEQIMKDKIKYKSKEEKRLENRGRQYSQCSG